MAHKIKIAVIGVGSMGSTHAKDIIELANIKLVAVCDIDSSRVDNLAQNFGVPAFYDHLEMLEKIELDAVLIATPHYDHPAISMASFERGIHLVKIVSRSRTI